MTRTIATTLAVLVVAALAGCATNKETLLPHGPATMQAVWDQYTSTSARSVQARTLIEARLALRRGLTAEETQAALEGNASYARTARNEIERQFKRLPNPDLLMYVFPHLVGTPAVPVPGYTTVFPLHERIEYALPGERTEDY